MYVHTLIVGGGPAGLQLAYFLHKAGVPYLVLEKEACCAPFFARYPHSRTLISLNKQYTGETDPDFNLRHDWNSLLSDEGCLFGEFSDELYPPADALHEYLNAFARRFSLRIAHGVRVERVDRVDPQDQTRTQDQDQGSTQETPRFRLTTTGGEGQYLCEKLVMASGLSRPYYPASIARPPCVRHYADYAPGHFQDRQVLDAYKNKTVLLVGSGNAAYELANLLEKVCATVVVLGRPRPLSIVSHYSGDVRSVYYPFLDGFFLKSLNAIDTTLARDQELVVARDPATQRYTVRAANAHGPLYPSPRLASFHEVVLCTGWTFDASLFRFEVRTTQNGKLPELDERYESVSAPGLYFVGALMHARDFRRSSGGFIHGFRYLVRLFAQLHYPAEVPMRTRHFAFTGDMRCYTDLCAHLFARIHSASSLYQMFGVLRDAFYYDEARRRIVYVHDVTMEAARHLDVPAEVQYVSLLSLEYGPQETDVNKLGHFNRWDPRFLHPRLHICRRGADGRLSVVDRVVLEEDLVADFRTQANYQKLYQCLKMCRLVV